jgi:hypothetical protein
MCQPRSSASHHVWPVLRRIGSCQNYYVLLAPFPSIMSLKVTSSGLYVCERIAYWGISSKKCVRLNSLSFLHSRRRIIQTGPEIVSEHKTIGNSYRVGMHIFIGLGVKGGSRLCSYSSAGRQPRGIASLCIHCTSAPDQPVVASHCRKVFRIF